MDYRISVKIKNSHWYEVAKEYNGAQEFEDWDSGQTPRFRRGVSFNFIHPVYSIEEFPNSSYQIKLISKKNVDEFITKSIDNVHVIKCNGEKEGYLVISESILEQIIMEKKPKGKNYINCYLKDVEIQEISPALWLSVEHYNQLWNKDFTLIEKQDIKILAEQSIIEV